MSTGVKPPLSKSRRVHLYVNHGPGMVISGERTCLPGFQKGIVFGKVLLFLDSKMYVFDCPHDSTIKF